jgi:hypothetical protein
MNGRTILLAQDAHGGLAASGVKAIIRTASINTGSSHRDEHLRSTDFFDAARFPAITFQSDKLAQAVNGFLLTGALTLHGNTRPVRIRGHVALPPTVDPHNVVVAEFIGETTIARRDFGILGGAEHNAWFDALRSATMGDSVRITLEIHAWMPDADHPPPSVTMTVARIDSIGIDSAVAHLRQAFVRDSASFAASEYTLDLVGQTLIAQRRQHERFLWLHAIARLLPHSTNAMTSVGMANEVLGDTGRAATWYRQALTSDSLNTRASLRLRFLGVSRPR